MSLQRLGSALWRSERGGLCGAEVMWMSDVLGRGDVGKNISNKPGVLEPLSP